MPTVVVAQPIEASPADAIASKLIRSCAFLMIYSLLRLGSLQGLLGLLAAATVLCCSAPGAIGMARSARHVKFCALVAAALACVSMVFVGTAMVTLPPVIEAELRTTCARSKSSSGSDVQDVISWGMDAAKKHHDELHHDHHGEEEGGDHGDGAFFQLFHKGGHAHRMLQTVVERVHDFYDDAAPTPPDALAADDERTPHPDQLTHCDHIAHRVKHLAMAMMMLGIAVELGLVVSALRTAKHARTLLAAVARM